MLHRHYLMLMSLDSTINTDFTGPAHMVLTNEQDAMPDASQEWGAWVEVDQSNGASSPTVTLKLQTSPDGITWIDVGTAVSTSSTEKKTSWQKLSFLLGRVRAVTVLGGGTKPDHKARVILTSTGSFKTRSGSQRNSSRG